MSIKAVKAVLLDLDDTLWPVAPVIGQAESALQTWLQQHAPAVAARYTAEQLRARRTALAARDPRFQYDLWALRHTLLREVMQECGEAPEQADRAMAVFAHARNQVSLYQDVVPALQKLGQTVALGSISNGFADLQAIGLAPHFKVSIAAYTFGCAKPDPRIFMAACEVLGLAPHQVLVAGDDLLLDVQGAQHAGMRGVWINRHGQAPDVAEAAGVRPDAICRDLYELCELFGVERVK